MGAQWILIVLILLAAGVHFWDRRKLLLQNDGYDERQSLLIRKGFQVAMMASFAVNICLVVFETAYPGLFSVSFVLSCFFFVPLVVLGIFSIIHDAYYPVKSNNRVHKLTTIQGVIGSTVIALASLYILLFDNSAPIPFFQKGGKGNVFLLLLSSISLAITFMYKIYKDKNEEE